MAVTHIELFSVTLIGYLLGSIPFAVLIARSKGIDILAEGSKNPGATNVKRVVGKWAGNFCFALDFLKGVIAAAWPALALLEYSDPPALGIIGLIAAIAGHSFSIFMGFRGGKGVAVAIGGLMVIMFWVVLAGIVVWLVVFYTTRYVSLASLSLGLSLPVFAFALQNSQPQLILAMLLAILIVFRHRSNIVRLLQGDENRFEK